MSKKIPTRKQRIELPAEWLVKTSKIASQRGVPIIFTPSKEVVGISGGWSTKCVFSLDGGGQEWVDHILSTHPHGASFPVPVHSGGDPKKSLRPYASFPLTGDDKAWVDPTTDVVHLVSATGVHLRSATLCDGAPDLSTPSATMQSIVFANQLTLTEERALSGLLVNDVSRPALSRISGTVVDGRQMVVASNGRGLVGYYVEGLPDNFTIPSTVKLLEMCEYGIVPANERDTNSHGHYRLSCGTLVVERYNVELPPYDKVIAQSLSRDPVPLLDAEAFTALMKQVKDLGLVADDTVIRFRTDEVDLFAGGVVAQFKMEVPVPDGLEFVFSTDQLLRLSVSDFELSVAPIYKDGGYAACQAVCRGERGIALLMGMRP